MASRVALVRRTCSGLTPVPSYQRCSEASALAAKSVAAVSNRASTAARSSAVRLHTELIDVSVATSSGRCTARCWATRAPRENPTTCEPVGISAATPSARSASVTPAGAGGLAPWPGRSGVTASISRGSKPSTGCQTEWSRPTPCNNTTLSRVIGLLPPRSRAAHCSVVSGASRCWGRPWAAAASATTISSGCGASAIRTSTV
jgi:hypothetical protein